MNEKTANAPSDELLQLLEQLGQLIARTVADIVPKGIGFAVLLFDQVQPGSEDRGWMTWVSNSRREDMKLAIQEMLARFRREDLGPPPASDVDDVAKFLLRASGSGLGRELTKETMRRMAATAIAVGASPGLARVDDDAGVVYEAP